MNFAIISNAGRKEVETPEGRTPDAPDAAVRKLQNIRYYEEEFTYYVRVKKCEEEL